ncbi:MAG: transketolase C-terminal domain-containing protein [Candidatus Shapirobacteria bacterium]|jgi:transketolase
MNSKNIDNKSIRQAFADTLFELAVKNPQLYVVDIGLRPSLYLDKFAARFKSRFIEAGIAESDAAAIAAGLAAGGKTVFLTSFACFSPSLNWGVIRQSICYNQKNVKIIGSHAGLMSGDLGATHQMLEDVALMRSLPNMEVFAPLDAVEMTRILPVIAHSPHPAYIRLPRVSTPIVYPQKLSFTIGKSQILKPGKDISVLGYGPILSELFVDDFKKYSLEIINCSSLKPLDSETILKSVKKTGRCLVIEDHQKNGGLGDAVASLILSSGLKCKFIHLGVNDSFGQSALNYFDLYHYYGLSPLAILQALKSLLNKK